MASPTSPDPEPPSRQSSISEPLGKGGYARLAELMSSVNSTAVFRRFAKLSVENILYLQADLVRLENKLRKIQEEDRHARRPRALYHMDWTMILYSDGIAKRGEGDNQQYKTIIEIQTRLREYRTCRSFIIRIAGCTDKTVVLTEEAILRYHRTLALEQPHPKVVHDIDLWIKGTERGGVIFIGEDADIWAIQI